MWGMYSNVTCWVIEWSQVVVVVIVLGLRRHMHDERNDE